MEENKNKQAKRNILILTFGVIAFVLIVNLGLGSFLQAKQHKTPGQTKLTTISPKKNNEHFSYKGEAGKTALDLLKEKAGSSVEQNQSGLIVSINGRKADEKKHEYWAFYVNKKLASVGPAAYSTQDTDTVEWKIEKY